MSAVEEVASFNDFEVASSISPIAGMKPITLIYHLAREKAYYETIAKMYDKYVQYRTEHDKTKDHPPYMYPFVVYSTEILMEIIHDTTMKNALEGWLDIFQNAFLSLVRRYRWQPDRVLAFECYPEDGDELDMEIASKSDELMRIHATWSLPTGEAFTIEHAGNGEQYSTMHRDYFDESLRDLPIMTIETVAFSRLSVMPGYTQYRINWHPQTA